MSNYKTHSRVKMLLNGEQLFFETRDDQMKKTLQLYKGINKFMFENCDMDTDTLGVELSKELAKYMLDWVGLGQLAKNFKKGHKTLIFKEGHVIDNVLLEESDRECISKLSDEGFRVFLVVVQMLDKPLRGKVATTHYYYLPANLSHYIDFANDDRFHSNVKDYFNKFLYAMIYGEIEKPHQVWHSKELTSRLGK
ncbi:hypothetical protein [Paenibacillus piri]|uniref:Uncharacterized protein n=1 Tax=Paenibacillus piri TaxID=2547395 RepID=A0A4R5KXR8_9BACL|nr:hypothetical protein [Paenibacillus piri]TDG00870.1 hypothetical protein E1757_04470 [Paenibacillus piri]